MSIFKAHYFWNFKTDQMEWEGLGAPFFKQFGPTGSSWHQSIAPEDWGTRLNTLLKAQSEKNVHAHHYKIHGLHKQWLQLSDQITAIHAANILIGFQGQITIQSLVSNTQETNPLFTSAENLRKNLYNWRLTTQEITNGLTLLVIVANESLEMESPEAFEHLTQVIAASLVNPLDSTVYTNRLSATTWVRLGQDTQSQHAFLARLKHYQSLDNSFPLQDFVWVNSEVIHSQETSPENILQKIDVLVNEGISYHTRFETVRHSAKIPATTDSPKLSLRNLSQAFRDHRLCLAFQPIHNPKTKETYYECLIRLCETNGRLRRASHFINFYESLGLIQTFDQKVLTLALAELYANPQLKLSINVSAITASTPLWLEILQAHLVTRPDIASRLIIELTETAVFSHMQESLRFLRKLQDLGCQTAIDDFGSGYLSFHHLRKGLANIIKIDGRFIQGLTARSENLKFIRLVLSLIHPNGLQCVAECVENKEIATLLEKEGVDYLQGYFVGRPQFLRPLL